MHCSEVKEVLLDAADGELSGPRAAPLEDHLSECPSCRAEYERLRAAAVAVRDAVPLLAPPRSYLTVERIARLTTARARGRKIFKLVTYRQFIAAAAVLAIVASAFFIVPSARRLRRLADATAEAPGAQAAAESLVPVVLAATEQGQPLSVVRSFPLGSAGWPELRAPAGPTHLIRTDSAGVRAPADHAFYDPDESSRWW